ncbi:hypothetical protein I4F81_005220 [Pyropia yezoensis]|uniref:Uncharacterized protein n=1 Tax=Pyropia yezoensis TaxID=2788 RepID=A0ACC3BXL2_PYRYE|nr:hypothetical protein I4F81_005220 [Neopyropia yezoensis]
MAAFVCVGAPALRAGGGRRPAAAVYRRRLGGGTVAPLRLPVATPLRRVPTLFMRASDGSTAKDPAAGGPDGTDADAAADAASDAASGDDPVMDVDDASSTTARSGGSSDSDSDYDSDELSAYPASLDGRSDSGSRDSEFLVNDTPAPSVSSALARLSRLAGGSGASSGEPPEESNELVKFVQSVPPPELMRRFKETAPPEVQAAMRQTLTSMLGSLPAHAFQTSVRTATANLVQLMSSLLLSGYLIRNAEYRYGLLQSLTSPSRQLSGTGAETSSKPRIEGGVAVFVHSDGSTSEMPVSERRPGYITTSSVAAPICTRPSMPSPSFHLNRCSQQPPTDATTTALYVSTVAWPS